MARASQQMSPDAKPCQRSLLQPSGRELRNVATSRRRSSQASGGGEVVSELCRFASSNMTGALASVATLCSDGQGRDQAGALEAGVDLRAILRPSPLSVAEVQAVTELARANAEGQPLVSDASTATGASSTECSPAKEDDGSPISCDPQISPENVPVNFVREEQIEMDGVQPTILIQGASAQIIRLRAATHLNGTIVECCKIDSASGRWIVKLPDGTERAIRPENLSAVVPCMHAPTPASHFPTTSLHIDLLGGDAPVQEPLVHDLLGGPESTAGTLPADLFFDDCLHRAEVSNSKTHVSTSFATSRPGACVASPYQTIPPIYVPLASPRINEGAVRCQGGPRFSEALDTAQSAFQRAPPPSHHNGQGLQDLVSSSLAGLLAEDVHRCPVFGWQGGKPQISCKSSRGFVDPFAAVAPL